MKKGSKYIYARKVEYKGVLLDSLLELRFVIKIEDKCSWIREPKTIFYDPDTLIPTSYLRENTRRYTPDFLVRKQLDHSAHIVELKPKAFKDSDQMKIRNQVLENYISNNNLDWKLVVLSREDIQLNDEQFKKYKEVIERNKNFNRKLELIKRDRKYSTIPTQYFSSIPILDTDDITSKEYIRYVKYGKLPEG